MKTPEEIKKGLEKCSVGRSVCEGCEFSNGNAGKWQKLMGDALTYIRLLETDNRCLNDTIRNLTELLNAAHEETAKAKRERDAAVEDAAMGECCETCLYGDTPVPENPCKYCYECRDWKWRGVCPDNMEVRDDE